MISIFESWRNQALMIRGWRRALLILLLGVLSVFALPPIHFVPALVPAFVGLVWLLDGSTSKTAENTDCYLKYLFCNSSFATGWWFGFGYFAAGLYWVSFSLLVDAQRFGWMIPIVIIGLSAFFAVYAGLVTFLSCRLSNPGPRRVIYFILFWVLSEWLRSWLFTGFPWNLLGSVWTFNEPIMQFASVFGVLGLSLVTVGVASAFSFVGYADKSVRFKTMSLILPLVLLAIIWAGGSWRMLGVETKFVNDVLLRLVQPNILQKNKWKVQFKEKNFNNLLALSSADIKPGRVKQPTHIIWPETATPFILDGNDPALRVIAQVISPKGALLTGSPRRTGENRTTAKLWNSLHVVSPNARIIATYDKFRLVPFGEYIPLRRYFDNFASLTKITGGRIDFSSGPGQRTISVPGAPPVSPLICYEVIFSGGAVSAGKKDTPQPEWLLNITNDAWFGVSTGPYQHLAAAQLRAVEEGLPLVRVANTGISAVIDGFGRIYTASNLNERTYIDSPLPRPLMTPTIFSKIKVAGIFPLIFLIFILSRFRCFV
jgi:apolipoprotein N-acyltransferase